MLRFFINLEWKKFTRASYFKKSIAINLLLGFVALLGIAYFAIFGVIAYYGIKEEMPDVNPVFIINKYLIFWFVLELNYRFFLQKIPFMEIKPFMIQNVKRKSVVHYLLGKSLLSMYNFFPFFFFLPFTISALIDGVSFIHIFPWFIAMLSIEVCIHFLIFLIDKNDKIFFGTLVTLLALIGLFYFDIVNIPMYSGKGLDAIYTYPFLVIIPLLLAVFLYRFNANILLKNFYIDDAKLKHNRKEEIKASDLSWLDNFGVMSTFLKNDIRLILRNTRSKQVVFLSSFFLLYGLLIYTNDTYSSSDSMLVMFSTFVTGGVLMTFGQYVPAWDSEYYKFLMSQNISYYKYLESKWWLMVVSVLVSLVLSLPYLFLGVKYYELIFATAMFNIGANSYITLIGGIYNKSRIKLNEKAKAFGSSKNFSMSQILISLPKLFGPIIIFYPFSQFYNFEVAILALSIFGIIGFLLKRPILKQIEKIYQEEKYETIQAFSEQ